MHWQKTTYSDPKFLELINRHYSRYESSRGKKYGRPGYSLVLRAEDETGAQAIFAWWRPKWESGLPQAQRFDGLKAIECLVFRNETKHLSSTLIKAAVEEVLRWEHAVDVEWSDGLVTSINSRWTENRRSARSQPGHCFLMAGWHRFEHPPTRNTDVWLQIFPTAVTSADANVQRWLADREALGFSERGLSQARLNEFMLLPGKKFGRLTVLRYSRLRPRPDRTGAVPIWWCRCDCSNEVESRIDGLKVGDVATCGACVQVVPPLPEQALREIALSIEWEGSIGVYELWPSIALGVRSFTPGLVDAVAALATVGDVYASAGKKPTRQWEARGKTATELAKQLLPFAVTKRKQAELVVAYPYGARGELVSDAIQVQREEMRALTKDLNRDGPRPPDPSWEQNAAAWFSAIPSLSEEQRMRLLALTIEFEGTIGVYAHQSRGSAGGYRFSCVVQVPQVGHRVVLLRIAQALAGDVGRFTALRKTKSEHEAPMLNWVVERNDQIFELVRKVEPYMTYKRPKAQLIVEFPTATFATRMWMAEETKRLTRELRGQGPKQQT